MYRSGGGVAEPWAGRRIGVKLTINGSPVLEDLVAYEKDGLTILVCGTCLTHFGLLEAKKIGETTNMLYIVTAMQLADKVINI